MEDSTERTTMNGRMNESESSPDRSEHIPESDLRIQLATERTLLAWIRTGLALMAFGFVVSRFALVLESLGLKTTGLFVAKATLMGIGLVLMGIVISVAAPLHYRSYFRRIEAKGGKVFIAWPLMLFVACAMAVLGIALAVYLLFVDLPGFAP